MVTKTVSENIGRCLTKTTVPDFQERIQRFKQFAHFSQFTNVNRKTTKLPENVEVRLDVSPQIGYGSILFGVHLDGTLEWLGEIIDSSD